MLQLKRLHPVHRTAAAAAASEAHPGTHCRLRLNLATALRVLHRREDTLQPVLFLVLERVLPQQVQVDRLAVLREVLVVDPAGPPRRDSVPGVELADCRDLRER